MRNCKGRLGGTQKATERNLAPRRHTGVTQEAPRRHPGCCQGTQEAPRRLPGDTQEAPKDTQATPWRHAGLKLAKTTMCYHRT